MGWIPNAYVTLTPAKRAQSFRDTDDDAKLERFIFNVCRSIDRHCKRHFYVLKATKFLTPQAPGLIRLKSDDLLSVSAFDTDPAGARTYSQSWLTASYDLWPVNAPSESPPSPYTQIQVTPASILTFPLYPLSTRIAGNWGYYQVLQRSTSTVATGGIDASATSLPVTDGTVHDVGQTLLIGNEQLAVTAIDTTANPDALTVVRGVNGTTAAAHVATTVIDVYTYPVIETASLLLLDRLWNRQDSPSGGKSSSTFGDQPTDIDDPDVIRLLDEFRRDKKRPIWPMRQPLAVAG